MEKAEVAKLYDAYAQDVFRLALSYLYNSQDAEDICHGVFLTLVEKDITQFPGSEKAWLLKCAANACKDQLKSHWKQNRTVLVRQSSVCLQKKWHSLQYDRDGHCGTSHNG